MKKVNFKPWVGVNYANGIGGKKVLVLGESHYCRELAEGGRCCPSCECCKMDEECHKFTINVMREFRDNYSGEGYEQTFLCFERAVAGHELSQKEREEFWDSVVFYNYMQYAQSGPRRPLEQRNDSSEAFREILEEYMPDCIIVWGKRLYGWLPGWNGEESEITLDNGDKTKVWTYDIKGKKIPAMAVYHPSSPKGKNWGYWHQFYKKFLGL